jgi:hypothetical protein
MFITDHELPAPPKLQTDYYWMLRATTTSTNWKTSSKSMMESLTSISRMGEPRPNDPH